MSRTLIPIDGSIHSGHTWNGGVGTLVMGSTAIKVIHLVDVPVTLANNSGLQENAGRDIARCLRYFLSCRYKWRAKSAGKHFPSNSMKLKFPKG